MRGWQSERIFPRFAPCVRLSPHTALHQYRLIVACKLIHATDPVIIPKYLDKLKHCKLNMAKLNKFRLLAGNCKIEYR